MNHSDGTCAVQYDDGDMETHVDPSLIRAYKKAAKNEVKQVRKLAIPQNPAIHDFYRIRARSFVPYQFTSSGAETSSVTWDLIEAFVYLWVASAVFRIVVPLIEHSAALASVQGLAPGTM
jgi:hypothetical protein